MENEIMKKAPEQEPERQQYFIKACSDILREREIQQGRKLTFHVSTFGCQMNAHDSEKLTGILEQMGFRNTEEEEEADFVIYNTCTVRENANQKLYGHLGSLKNRKDSRPDMLIAICGCMMQQKETVEYIRKTYPFVDLIFGTFNFYKIAELLYRRMGCGERHVGEVLDKPLINVEHLPTHRKYTYKSGINIMYGCDNYCTYCVVPYVRGRERSRVPEDILREAETLSEQGCVEIMLLGQNVNSYGVRFMGESDILKKNPEYGFPDLMADVCRTEGIRRVRFMTSHPKDLSDRLIDVIAENPKICRQIHLPVQSGSNRVLKRMNRHYTREQYLALVDRIRKKIPDVSLTTDIMVGFPGETEEDFRDTMDIVSRVHYDQVFTFIYSRRSGTPAAGWEQVPKDTVNRRFQELLQLVRETASREAERFVGRDMEALVEEEDTRAPGHVTGRLDNNMLVHFPGDRELIGTFVPVHLDEAKGFYYIGHRV